MQPIKRVYKPIVKDGETVGNIYGSNRPIQTEDKTPEWSSEPELSFRYRNQRYFISEFESIEPHRSDYLKEFDGINTDSFFSAILIKLDSENDTVKAFTLIV